MKGDPEGKSHGGCFVLTFTMQCDDLGGSWRREGGADRPVASSVCLPLPACLTERVGVNWSTGGAEREAAEPGVLYIPRPPGHAERKNGHEQVANF